MDWQVINMSIYSQMEQKILQPSDIAHIGLIYMDMEKMRDN